MVEICPVCGLPKDLCICGEIEKERQTVRVRVEKRRYGKEVTIVEGVDPNGMNVKKLLTELKSRLACGGTFKNGSIILQGDHRSRVKKILLKWGIPEEIIEME